MGFLGSRLALGPDTCCSPCHSVPLRALNEGVKCDVRRGKHFLTGATTLRSRTSLLRLDL